MERSPNQRERTKTAQEKPLKRKGRPTASRNCSFESCQSTVCRFIQDSEENHLQVCFAKCCSTFFLQRRQSKLAHPNSFVIKLKVLMKENQINSHEQFHQFIIKEGLEVTVDLKHQNVSFSIPQHEVQIDQPILQEHHQIEKETQTTTPEQMVPKSLFDEERYMRMDYERKLQSVFELLTQWERSGDIGRSCFAQEMRNTLASKR